MDCKQTFPTRLWCQNQGHNVSRAGPAEIFNAQIECIEATIVTRNVGRDGTNGRSESQNK